MYVSHGHPDHCADLQPCCAPGCWPTGPARRCRVRAGRQPGPPPRHRRAGLVEGVPPARSTRGDFGLGPYTVEPERCRTGCPTAGAGVTGGGVVLAYTGTPEQPGSRRPGPGRRSADRRGDLRRRHPDRHAGNLSTPPRSAGTQPPPGTPRAADPPLARTDPQAAAAAARRGYRRTGRGRRARPGAHDPGVVRRRGPTVVVTALARRGGAGCPEGTANRRTGEREVTYPAPPRCRALPSARRWPVAIGPGHELKDAVGTAGAATQLAASGADIG